MKKACVVRWNIAAFQAPMPIATIINPNWEIVEKANTFFISYCAKAKKAELAAVKQPTIAITIKTVSLNNGKIVHSKNTPAATIVAAWIREDTDVGPSIASGSQMCSGNCADLAMAPKKKASPAKVTQGALLSRE